MVKSNFVEVVKVVKVSPELTKQLRKEFRINKDSIIGHIDNDIYDVHHIVGLSIGGDNSRSNLVIMNKKDHSDLHKYYIDPQTHNMRVGEKRFIYLPKNYNFNSPSFKEYQFFMFKMFNIKINSR